MNKASSVEIDDVLFVAVHSLDKQDLGLAWLSYAEEFLCAFFRERFWFTESHRQDISDSMLGHRSTLLLGAFAIENLVKGCVYEAYKDKEFTKEQRQILFKHELSDIAGLLKEVWSVTLSDEITHALDDFTELIQDGIAKYPIPKGANSEVHSSHWGEDRAKDIKRTWNFFWNELYHHFPKMATRTAISPRDSFERFNEIAKGELEILIKGLRT